MLEEITVKGIKYGSAQFNADKEGRNCTHYNSRCWQYLVNSLLLELSSEDESEKLPSRSGRFTHWIEVSGPQCWSDKKEANFLLSGTEYVNRHSGESREQELGAEFLW
jgi:hypothetical protein